MTDDLERIREGIEELKMSLAIHDQRAMSSVETIKGTQDRLATAIDKVAEATVAIRDYAERMDKRNGEQAKARANGPALKLSPQMVATLVGGGILLGALLKGGSQAATMILAAFGIK